MAEPRRATLSTLSGPFVADKKKDGNGDDEATAAKATAQRFVLTLGESTDEGFPEFFYPELLLRAAAQGKTQKKNNDDPFNEEERERKEVEALAKKFEEKYSTTKQKLRRDRVQDLVDIGYGYDETDSFIDNSEAYDELVPASLTTKYGGFYINTGTLQFRPASDSEDDNAFSSVDNHKKPLKKFKEGEEKMIKKRKRKEEGPENEKKLKKMKLPKQIGITPLNSDKSEKLKKKKSKGTISTPEMIERFKKEKHKEAMKLEKVAQTAPASRNTNAGTLEEPVKAPVSKLEPLPMPDYNADQLLPNMFGPGCELDLLQVANAAHNLTNIDLDTILEDSPNSSLSQESEAPCQQVQPNPKLPDGLPAPLDMKIKQLAEVAKTIDSEDKQKLFSQDVSHILLDIEVQTMELNSQLRGGVYVHLASLLGCNKDWLLRRIKKLHQHEQDGRLKSPMYKLRDAVSAVMSEQTIKYQETYQAHTQAKIMSGEKEDKDKNASDDDDDDEKPGKRVFGPRKKFQWNTEIRDLLCNVVKVKMAGYDTERSKSQSAEDYLKAFLEAEVKPLWPKGWMQSRMLFKESRVVHGHITAAPVQYAALKKETSTSCSLQEKKRQEVCCKPKIESANVKDASKESTKKKLIPPAKAKLKQDVGLKTERKPLLVTTTSLISARPSTPNLLPTSTSLTVPPPIAVSTNTMANQPAQPKPMVAQAMTPLGQSSLAQSAAIQSRPSSSSLSSGPSGAIQTMAGMRTVIASSSPSSSNSSVLVSALPMQSRSQHVVSPVYNIDNSLDDDFIMNPGAMSSVTETLAALNSSALIDKFCLPGLLVGPSDSMTKSTARQPTSVLEKKPVQQNPTSATARSSPAPAGHYSLSLLADQAANRKQLPQQGKSASGHPQVVIQDHRNVISTTTQLQKQKPGTNVVSHTHQKPALQQSSHRQYQQNSNPSARVANQQYVIKASVASHSKDASQKQHQPHIQQHHIVKTLDRLLDRSLYKQTDVIKIPVQTHSLPQASSFPSNSLGNNTKSNLITGVIGHSGVSTNSSSSGQKFKMPFSPSTKGILTGGMASAHPSNSPTLSCSAKRLAAGAPKAGQNIGSTGSASTAHGFTSTGKVTTTSHKASSHPLPPPSSPASSTSPNQIASGSSLLATGMVAAAALLPVASSSGLSPKAATVVSSTHKPPASTSSHKPPPQPASAAQPPRSPLHTPIRNILIPVNFTNFDSIPTAHGDAAMSGRDAIITGPAPGTFHHGLSHSLYTGLHSSPQPQGPQPHSALPARFPQSFPDASSLQKDASNLPRKTQ